MKTSLLLSLPVVAQAVMVTFPVNAAEPGQAQPVVSADGFNPNACIWKHGTKNHPGHWSYDDKRTGPLITRDCDDAANGRPHIAYGISPDIHQRVRMEGPGVVVTNAQVNPCATAGLLDVSFAVGECPVAYGYGYYGGSFGGSFGYGWGYGYGRAPLPPATPLPPVVRLPPRVWVDRNPPPPVNPPAPGDSISVQRRHAAWEATNRPYKVAQNYEPAPSGYEGGYGARPGSYPTVGTSQQPAGAYDPVNHPLGANGIPESSYNPVTTDYNGRGQAVGGYDYSRNGTSYGRAPNGTPNGNTVSLPDADHPGQYTTYNRSDIPALTGQQKAPDGSAYTFNVGPNGKAQRGSSTIVVHTQERVTRQFSSTSIHTSGSQGGQRGWQSNRPPAMNRMPAMGSHSKR